MTLPSTCYPPALAKPVCSNVSVEFGGRGSVQLLKNFCCRYLTSKFVSNKWTENPANALVIVKHTFLNRCSKQLHKPHIASAFFQNRLHFSEDVEVFLSWEVFQSSGSLPLQKWSSTVTLLNHQLHTKWAGAFKNICSKTNWGCCN